LGVPGRLAGHGFRQDQFRIGRHAGPVYVQVEGTVSGAVWPGLSKAE
jgi:hypothetical protein